MSFDPRTIRTFRFVGYDWDESSATATLDYAFDRTHAFRETLTFRGAPGRLDAARRAALDVCLRHLHLAAGVSYYKAAAPPRIEVDGGTLDEATAAFFDALYLEGLGEFSYQNELPLEERIRFPFAPGPAERPPAVELSRATAVPLGGGKDSIVTLAALQAAGEPIVALSLGDLAPVRAVGERAGVPVVWVERRLAPRLLELNREGAYNGHVPFSAILAFVLAAAALVYGFDAAALSNERSASAPDVVWRGRAINHEWSKGFAFERAAGELLAGSVLPGFDYFSLLRPYSELAVAALFSRLDRFHDVFLSCNAAFRLDPTRRGAGWCRDCPKCRFVFLALAPFLEPRRLREIFGGDLLADEAQVPGYEELAGLTEHTPFECVGEVEETRAALALAAADPAWRDAPVVRRLAAAVDVGAAEAGRRLARTLTPSAEHRVPERLSPVLETLDTRLARRREALARRPASS